MHRTPALRGVGGAAGPEATTACYLPNGTCPWRGEAPTAQRRRPPNPGGASTTRTGCLAGRPAAATRRRPSVDQSPPSSGGPWGRAWARSVVSASEPFTSTLLAQSKAPGPTAEEPGGGRRPALMTALRHARREYESASCSGVAALFGLAHRAPDMLPRSGNGGSSPSEPPATCVAVRRMAAVLPAKMPVAQCGSGGNMPSFR